MVEVTVVKEGKGGILGLGADNAVVRVRPLTTPPKIDIAEVAKEVLERLLALLGVAATITYESQPMDKDEEEEEEATSIIFNISGDDLGILIGRRGQTVDSLQYILRLILEHRTKAWVPIMVDVAGYKQRRYQALQEFAQQMAEKVRTKGTPFTFEPMPAYERRLIHMALAKDPEVTTESTGMGETRKVVISLRER